MISRIPMTIRVAIIFLVQAGLVFWMVWDRSQILSNGDVVRLQVRPVDPRDIFRGDYVILDYEISRLRPAALGSRDIYGKHDTVYVLLEKADSDLWVARSIHRERPNVDSGQIYISGRVRYYSSYPASPEEKALCPDERCRELFIRYGIESYFVPEGEGLEIENARNDMQIVIVAAVAKNGRAAIKGLIMDGELRYEEPLF